MAGNFVEWQTHWVRNQWQSWINHNWQSLVGGVKLEMPRWMTPSTEAGFTLLPVAHPVGQARDWGLSMPDGSRIHVHEYPDGRFVTHRDKFDPARGFQSSVAHLMQETPYPAILMFAGVGALFIKVFDG